MEHWLCLSVRFHALNKVLSRELRESSFEVYWSHHKCTEIAKTRSTLTNACPLGREQAVVQMSICTLGVAELNLARVQGVCQENPKVEVVVISRDLERASKETRELLQRRVGEMGSMAQQAARTSWQSSRWSLATSRSSAHKVTQAESVPTRAIRDTI